jgi:hypothetical protein
MTGLAGLAGKSPSRKACRPIIGTCRRKVQVRSVPSVPSRPIAARIPSPILRIHAMSPAVMTTPRLACGEGKTCRNPRRSHTHTNHFHLAESTNREDVQAAASSVDCM